MKYWKYFFVFVAGVLLGVMATYFVSLRVAMANHHASVASKWKRVDIGAGPNLRKIKNRLIDGSLSQGVHVKKTAPDFSSAILDFQKNRSPIWMYFPISGCDQPQVLKGLPTVFCLSVSDSVVYVTGSDKLRKTLLEAGSKNIYFSAKGEMVGLYASAPIIKISSKNALIRSQAYSGWDVSKGARMAVSEWFASNGKFPKKSVNSSYGLAASSKIEGKYVQSVSVGPNGWITVTYNRNASSEISGTGHRTLVESPVLSDGFIKWTCTHSTIDYSKYLASVCQ